MPSVLIVGATRGLGRSLVTHYSSNPSSSTQGTPYTIYATTRSSSAPTDSWATKQNIHWLLNVDLEKGPEVAENLAKQIEVKADVYKDGIGLEDGSSTSGKLSTVIITAGYFATEDFGKAKWEEEVRMYTLSSVAPVFVVEALSKHGLFIEQDTSEKDGDEKGGDKKDKKGDWTGTKVILVSSESGSITLRHEQEGGGNFAHHGSKAALNMVGKQLSFDLKGKGVGVGIVHPSFMRTEMTAGIGFDKFWDDGGALPPDEAAKILADWVEKDFDITLTGTYWAPRGTRDIGNWEVVMGGDEIKGPVKLPW